MGLLKKRLAVIIVNYRTPDLTVDCLTSLESEIRSDEDIVVVVDNASGDGSFEKIESSVVEQGWGSWVRPVQSPVNGGFSAGNNFGIAQVEAEAYLLLNSDTIVHEGCLEYCWNVVQDDKSIGVMSCLLLNSDGTAQNVTRKFPTPFIQTLCSLGLPWIFPRLFGWADPADDCWDRKTEKRDVDWIGGAFLFVRGDVLRDVGSLSDDFFFYGEDIEFSHRMYKAGYRRYYDPTVSTTHLGGSSSKPVIQRIDARSRHRWKARYLVQKKCYGFLASYWLRFVDITKLILTYIRLSCLGKRNSDEYRMTVDVLAMLLRMLFSEKDQNL